MTKQYLEVLNFMNAGVQEEEERGKRVADAAKEAGLQHFIYSSVGGADRNSGVPHLESKWHVKQYTRELELLYSIVRRTTFMTNMMESSVTSQFVAFTLMQGEFRKPIQMMQFKISATFIAKCSRLRMLLMQPS